MYDFSSFMVDHDFTSDHHEFEATISGFDYDIHFALLDDRSIFDTQRSRTYRHYDDLSAMVQTDLVTHDGDVDSGVRFFHERWSTELRYLTPVREIIDVHQSPTTATIHVLTVTRYNAASLLFRIT